METKINIAEILKDKPKGTKLYTDAFGELSIEDIFAEDELGINLSTKDGDDLYFYNDGKYNVHGEPILFPSKEMRDWSKFAWKKGDLLVGNNGKREVLFSTWVNDSYTKFVGLHCLITNDNEEVEYDNGTTVFNTNDFKCVETEDAVQTYINTIEERLDGKLNRETLEIEPAQPEFKDGDVITIIPHIGDKLIYLFKAEDDEKYYGYAFLDGNIAIVNDNCYCEKDFCTARPSTEEEKQQLFDGLLAKKNKAWDAEKKMIVDLKPKVELKPFDKVLCRDDIGKEWHIDLFESTVTHDSKYNYKCMANIWKFCIPYDGNELLLGTTKDVEG